MGETGDKSSVNAVAKEVVAETEETPVSVDNEVSSAASQESANDSDGAAGESNETSPVDEATGEVNPAASEESTDSAEPEDAGEQEAEETPEIKVSLTTTSIAILFNDRDLLDVFTLLIYTFCCSSTWVTSLKQHQLTIVSLRQIKPGTASLDILNTTGRLD